MDYERLMHLAILEAKKSGFDVPVGALIVNESGELLSVAHNQRELKSDPTSHAEIVAIRTAGRSLGTWRLQNCTLVVTLEPCAMCAGAIVAARIPRVIFGAWERRSGSAGSTHDLLRDPLLRSSVEVIPGVLADDCERLLRDFFLKRRKKLSS